MILLRLLAALALLALVGAGGFWWLTRPQPLPADALAGLAGDIARGERVFYAGGCAACHAAPGAEDEARLVLAGGRAFPSDFGTFYAPNISPDPERGIGGWSVGDLANAMLRGLSPEGAHYYPAFPYTSYVRTRPQDIADLHAFLATLPASNQASRAHDLSFPFTLRRGLGLWKRAFLDDGWILEGALSEEEERGRYLAEALGHCGECHTPRNLAGALRRDAWMTGAPDPSGKGRIPALAPGALDWSAADIAEYLRSGFTPEYDVAGGHMVEVIANTKMLPDADRAALAAYLKALPAAAGAGEAAPDAAAAN